MVERTRRRTTKWNLFFHYVSLGFGMVSGILMFPLNLRHISIGMYGAWMASGNVLVWLTIVDPGLSAAIQQLVANAYGGGDRKKVSALVWSGIAISAVLVLLLGIAGLFLIPMLPSILNLPSSIDWATLHHACFIELVASVLTVFGYAVISSNLGLQSSLGAGLVYVTSTTVSILVQIYMLLHGYGVIAIPAANLVRGGGMLAGSFVYLIFRFKSEKYRLLPDFTEVRSVLRVVSFTFFGKIAGVLSANLDGVFVARTLGTSVVPMLRATRSPIDLCSSFVQRPAVAMAPAIAHVVGAGEIEQKGHVLLRFTAIASWLVFLMAAGFAALNHSFVRLWVGDKLFAGTAVNSILVANSVLVAIVGTMSVLTFALGDIKKSTIVSGIQSLLTVGFLYIGSRYYGLIGVVLAPLAAAVLVGGWYQPYSFARRAKLHRAQVSGALLELLKSAAAGVVAIAIGCIFTVRSWPGFVVAVAAVVTTFFLVLVFLSETFRNEIKHSGLPSLMARMHKRTVNEAS